MESATIPVRGMTCMGCVASVKRVVSSMAGVGAVDVTLTPAQARVTHDPAQAPLQTIKNAIRDAGYDVE